MRGIDLPRVPDDAINDNQILVLDDPTQSFSIELAQLKKFLGIGENSILIQSGTDIYTYFKTAKSGQYYGENLINVAHTGAWHAFDWTTHDQERGTLIETADNSELAVHALAGGAWTKKKIISEAGGTFIDRVIVNSDGSVISLKNKTLGKALYIRGEAPDGIRRFYLGSGADNDNSTQLHNDAGSNGLSARSSGDVWIYVGPDATDKFVFSANGTLTPPSYANFDARYQKVNTASKAANGWKKDTNTGIIDQWGSTSNTPNSSAIPFPIAYPSACYTVVGVDRGVGSVSISLDNQSLTQTYLNAASATVSISWESTGAGAPGALVHDVISTLDVNEFEYYYSASTNSFYPTELHADYLYFGTWPDDAIGANDSIVSEFMLEESPEGKMRVAGADGMPEWADTLLLELTPAQAQAQKHALLKKSGAEIDALRDVVAYAEPEEAERYADSLEEWKRYRAAVYVATPEEAVKIPLPE